MTDGAEGTGGSTGVEPEPPVAADLFGDGLAGAREYVELLATAGVAVIGGPDFGIHGEGYIRLSYANSAENIRRALERMGTFRSELKPA